MSETNILLSKLDQFIRKYYKNRLIRGSIWSLAVMAALYLAFVLLEYFFRFSIAGRTVLFFTFVAIAGFLLARLVVVPALLLARIGKVITYDQAARIVGSHFGEIEDKLLNTLQLLRHHAENGESSSLLAAGIEQKTRDLKVFRFNMAIDLRKNLRFMRYAAVPLLVILTLAIVSPRTVSEPTKRIIRFDQAFTPPLPFTLTVQNKTLTALQQDDFELRVKAEGEEVPSELLVVTPEGTFKMARKKGFQFTYLFRSLQGNTTFRLAAGDFRSEPYELKVFPRPTILSFDLVVHYPPYVGKQDEKLENQGDLVVPEGTVVNWNFYTKDVTAVRFRTDERLVTLTERQGNTFTTSQRIGKALNYSISPLNDNTYLADSLRYRINVVNDGYPSIFVTESADSALSTTLFFRGTIKDDYGFTKLVFSYAIGEKGDTAAPVFHSEAIPFEKNVTNQVFHYAADLRSLLPGAGQEIRYFFEVWDNDGIHGPKSTRSELRSMSTPTLEEIAQQTGKNEQLNQEDLKKSLKDVEAMKKAMDELSRKMVDQNNISWQEKKKIEEMLRNGEKISERIEEIKKRNEENVKSEENFLETNERIVEKQKQLNDMMDQMLPDELKKMIQEMRQMLDQVDKEKLGEMMEKMKVSNKELETQLDRNLALMKQLEFDRKLETTVKELRKNADDLDKLADDTEKKQGDNQALLDKQEEIKQKSDTLAKRTEELQKQGKELETPTDLGNTKEKQDQIDKNLGESSNSLKQNKNKEASGSQKKAAQKMREMADQMESAGQDSESDQLAEDEANLRMILENLVRLSFDQEDMIGVTHRIARNDPRYTALVARQKEFGDKMQVVEDSLVALAKRQIAIQAVVTKEIAAINQNIGMTLEAMDARNINLAVAKQQFTMTSINNLALLLNEAMQKMNEQSNSCKSQKAGNKSCNKPGGKGKGKMSAKSMKEMQDQIGKQLQKMKEGMEAAKKAGQGKPSPQGMSRDLAKLAAQQEALRNAMQKYQDDMGTKGVKEQGNLGDAARDMEQIEKDLINKRITQETIRRQQNIMSRLLESEKAEQMRDQEEKRESTEAKSYPTSNPAANLQYNPKKRTGQDNIQLILPGLNSFYKSKVSTYIVKIER